MNKPIIGVMGPGDDATESDKEIAFALGKSIAQQGWVLLNGGRNVGVMDAVSRGAASEGGIVIGVLPYDTRDGISTGVTIPIVTGMGQARNVINILSSDVVIVCGMNPGTASEAALAIRNNTPIIFIQQAPETIAFFQSLSTNKVCTAATPENAIERILNGTVQ